MKSTAENLLLWEQRIQEKIPSPMTVEEWCKKNGMSKHQYNYWNRRSGSCEDPPIILYEYTRTRSGKHAKEFLAGFNGFHVSDAYDGYEKVEGITRCLCFSHLRRYYLEVIPLDSGKNDMLVFSEMQLL